MDDLLDIFRTLPPSVLVLDKSLAPTLNALTNNSFSSFLKSAQLEQTVWFPESISSAATIPLHLPTVFLINLLSDESFPKLSLLSDLIHQLQIPHPHLIVYHPLLDASLHSYVSNIGLESQLSTFHIWSSMIPSISHSGNITIHSLDLPSAFKDLYLNNSPLPLQLLASYLLKLNIESNYSLRITNNFLKGPFSNQFYSIYTRLYDSHILSLPDKKRKIIQDIDDTIFSDTHSFYNSAVHLISIDRSNDLISCVLSQLSYTGIISEFFNLSSPKDFFKLPPENTQLSIASLFSAENQISNIIGDLNFSHVGPILNKNAKLLQEQLNKKDSLRDINEIKLFVNDLSNLNSTKSLISTHTSIADLIISSLNASSPPQLDLNIPLLEDIPLSAQSNILASYYSQIMDLQHSILNSQANTVSILKELSSIIHSYSEEVKLYDIFKILILLSIVKNGVNSNDFANHLYNDMVFKFTTPTVLPILLNLQKLKIITFNNSSNINLPSFLNLSNNTQLTPPISQSSPASQSITDFPTLSTTLNLLPIHEDSSSTTINSIQDYDDANFTYTGYVPILTRLIQSIYTRSFISSPDTDRAIVYGWNNLELSSLSTPTTQSFLVPNSKKQLFNSIVPPKISDLSSTSKSAIIIVALGGITWSEISSIKYVIAKNPLTKSKKVIILTTGIINSNHFISSFATAS